MKNLDFFLVRITEYFRMKFIEQYYEKDVGVRKPPSWSRGPLPLNYLLFGGTLILIFAFDKRSPTKKNVIQCRTF